MWMIIWWCVEATNPQYSCDWMHGKSPDHSGFPGVASLELFDSDKSCSDRAKVWADSHFRTRGIKLDFSCRPRSKEEEKPVYVPNRRP